MDNNIVNPQSTPLNMPITTSHPQTDPKITCSIRSNGGSKCWQRKRKKTFYRQTGENDPYDRFIAPLNIYANQVIPVGLHNLSKRNSAFIYYKDFLRRLQNKVYFSETKPGIFEKNSKSELILTSWQKQYEKRWKSLVGEFAIK